MNKDTPPHSALGHEFGSNRTRGRRFRCLTEGAFLYKSLHSRGNSLNVTSHDSELQVKKHSFLIVSNGIFLLNTPDTIQLCLKKYRIAPIVPQLSFNYIEMEDNLISLNEIPGGNKWLDAGLLGLSSILFDAPLRMRKRLFRGILNKSQR
jgi:hypothetical protein